MPVSRKHCPTVTSKMAASMLQKFKILIKLVPHIDKPLFGQQTRSYYRTRHRGLPPDKARSWNQRKADLEATDPEKSMSVNIGLPVASAKTRMTRTDMRALKKERNMVALEKLSRDRKLVVPVSEVHKESFPGSGQRRIHQVAEHHGIYRDLFGDAYFHPQFLLGVGYKVEGEDDMVNPVFFGNCMSPTEASSEPYVQYQADADKLYTLCMTAPDSHLEEKNKEYVHWMVANIPGSAVKEGEQLFSYLPLFPVHGTGHHRYVFVLYQHDKKVDFTMDGITPDSTSLRDRTFDTLEFYRKHQDDITPVALAFFQAEWDESVREVFHKTLDMDEPRFQFLEPHRYVPRQKLWPIQEPFHKYMDRYRDVKDIGEEVLKEKLKMADPFKPRPPRPKYPNLERLGPEIPSWLKIKMVEKRNRKSYWKYLDD